MREWARICRRQAHATTDKATRQSLMSMASRYEVDAASEPPSLSALYYDQPAGAFQEGFVFDAPADLMRDFSRRASPGYWRCDIAHGERLSWSEDVYELFGLRGGVPVEREWAVDRYTPQSRERLARVRDHALRGGLGFMLDAEIEPAAGPRRWIRIFAVPVLDETGRPTQLQGMKRQL